MNWASVLDWDPAPLREYSSKCTTMQQQLQTVADDLVADLNSLTGTGRTVTAAQDKLRKRIKAIEDLVNYFISASEIASEGVQGISKIKADIEDVKQLADSYSIHIDTSGVASFLRSIADEFIDFLKDPLQRTRLLARITQRIAAIIVEADALALELATMIAALDKGTFDNGVHYSATGTSRPTLPPKSASPEQVASWWNALSDKDKQWMIKQHPDVIGNLDGVDYTSRSQANQIMLPRHKKQAAEDLQKFYDTYGTPDPSSPDAAFLLSEEKRLKDRVTALDNIENTLKKANDEKPPVPRYLMQLDASGPNILAAISQNNPDEADHIGVIVPGMTTSVAGNGEGGSILDYDGHATTMRKAAQEAAGPNAKVAMVEFFGYDAPPGVVEAATPIMAHNGAKKLASFLNGIDAVREHGKGDAHITVASHSYGSTTAGIAATLVGDGVIDDLVQFGSPGSGVQDVGEFHVPEGHTYVSAAPYLNDMVQGVGPDDWFGKNPDTMDGYKHLSGDVGPTHWGIFQGGITPLIYPDPFALHSEYFKEGTAANRDIASVIGGNPPS